MKYADVKKTIATCFNTPEGVEGFSSTWMACWWKRDRMSVSIPRRVLRGFRATPSEGMPRRKPASWGSSVSIPRRVLRGFRGSDQGFPGVADFARQKRQVSIPRRVLRGFRDAVAGAHATSTPLRISRFNTPEGVEGFSSPPELAEAEGPGPQGVSIPRRVLRGFRGPVSIWNSMYRHWLPWSPAFQYPGGC